MSNSIEIVVKKVVSTSERQVVATCGKIAGVSTAFAVDDSHPDELVDRVEAAKTEALRSLLTQARAMRENVDITLAAIVASGIDEP